MTLCRIPHRYPNVNQSRDLVNLGRFTYSLPPTGNVLSLGSSTSISKKARSVGRSRVPDTIFGACWARMSLIATFFSRPREPLASVKLSSHPRQHIRAFELFERLVWCTGFPVWVFTNDIDPVSKATASSWPVADLACCSHIGVLKGCIMS